MDNEISLISLFLLLFTVLPILIINRILKLKINKNILISILRMILQLAFVGIYLQYIFALNNPAINILYLIIMIVIASAHSIRSSSLKIRYLFLPIFFSVAIPQIVVLLIFNILIAGKEHLFDAKFIIPVGGMLLGNCLNGNIVALNNFYNGIREDEKRYNYYLTLGASSYQAITPYLRKSLNIAILPTLASMATTGLVSLPGMMTGQILAGSLPLTAIKYQGAIFIAIFTAKYFSILLSILFSKNRGFTSYKTINRDIFTL